MDVGNILQVSPPKEIYHNPKSKFVSEFIGNINTFETKILSSNKDELSIYIEGIGNVKINNKYEISDSDIIYSAIRPEEISISKISKSSNNKNYEGIIKNISFYGESTYFYVQLNNSEKVIMVSNYEEKDFFKEKDKCYINFDLNNLKIIKD